MKMPFNMTSVIEEFAKIFLGICFANCYCQSCSNWSCDRLGFNSFYLLWTFSIS